MVRLAPLHWPEWPLFERTFFFTVQLETALQGRTVCFKILDCDHIRIFQFCLSRKKLFWSHRSGNKCMRISNSLIIITLFSRLCKCQKLNACSSHSFLSAPPFSLSISFPLFYSFSISFYFRFMFSNYFFLSILFLSYLLTSFCHFTILLHFISVLYLCYLCVISML